MLYVNTFFKKFFGLSFAFLVSFYYYSDQYFNLFLNRNRYNYKVEAKSNDEKNQSNHDRSDSNFAVF